MKKQNTAFLLMLIIFCGINCANAFDAPQFDRGAKTPPSREQMKADMEKRIEEFNRTLLLTDEQKAKAKEIRIKGHEKMRPYMEMHKVKMEELKAVGVQSGAQSEKIRNEIKSIDMQIRKIRLENEKEFQAILSEEQKVKFEKIKEEGKKHYMEHKFPQNPENFQRPMMPNMR